MYPSCLRPSTCVHSCVEFILTQLKGRTFGFATSSIIFGGTELCWLVRVPFIPFVTPTKRQCCHAKVSVPCRKKDSCTYDLLKCNSFRVWLEEMKFSLAGGGWVGCWESLRLTVFSWFIGTYGCSSRTEMIAVKFPTSSHLNHILILIPTTWILWFQSITLRRPCLLLKVSHKGYLNVTVKSFKSIKVFREVLQLK